MISFSKTESIVPRDTNRIMVNTVIYEDEQAIPQELTVTETNLSVYVYTTPTLNPEIPNACYTLS